MPRTHVKAVLCGGPPVNQHSRGRNRVSLVPTSWLARLSQLASSRFRKGSHHGKYGQRSRKTLNVNFWSPHIHAHTYLYMCAVYMWAHVLLMSVHETTKHAYKHANLSATRVVHRAMRARRNNNCHFGGLLCTRHFDKSLLILCWFNRKLIA